MYKQQFDGHSTRKFEETHSNGNIQQIGVGCAHPNCRMSSHAERQGPYHTLYVFTTIWHAEHLGCRAPVFDSPLSPFLLAVAHVFGAQSPL